MRRRLLLALVALGLTLASVGVPGSVTARYPDIMGCEEGCTVAAGGLPLPWVVDYPGLSVAHSVWLGGVLLGEDRVRPGAFALSLMFWLGTVWLGLWLAERWLARRRGPDGPLPWRQRY